MSSFSLTPIRINLFLKLHKRTLLLDEVFEENSNDQGEARHPSFEGQDKFETSDQDRIQRKRQREVGVNFCLKKQNNNIVYKK